MARQRPDSYVIRSAAQLRAIGSPQRLRVLRAIQDLGPCTVAELARHLGCKPASLYYHVHALVNAGVVEVVDERHGKGPLESTYDTVAHKIKVDPQGASKAYREALGKLASASLRRADRLHQSAVMNPGLHHSGSERQRVLLQAQVRLSKSSLRCVNRRIDELMEFLYSCDRVGNGDSVSITIVVSPAG